MRIKTPLAHKPQYTHPRDYDRRSTLITGILDLVQVAFWLCVAIGTIVALLYMLPLWRHIF